MAAKQRFPLSWTVRKHLTSPVSQDEAEKFGHQACDAVAIASITNEANGGVGVNMATVDGATGDPLSSSVLFRVWVSFAKFLSRSRDLGDGERDLCRRVVAIVRGEDENAAPKGGEAPADDFVIPKNRILN